MEDSEDFEENYRLQEECLTASRELNKSGKAKKYSFMGEVSYSETLSIMSKNYKAEFKQIYCEGNSQYIHLYKKWFIFWKEIKLQDVHRELLCNYLNEAPFKFIDSEDK
jgi:hypothetical protein